MSVARAIRTIAVLALLAGLVLVGWRSASRILDRQSGGGDRDTAASVADAWAAATTDGDVDRLLELVAARADADELAALHAEVLPVLGPERSVTVAGVATDGNRAVATLKWEARPGASDGIWGWSSDLELIRGRGVWSVDWEPTAVHPGLAPGWRLAVADLPPSRAPILDRTGRSLSPTGAAVEIGVQPGRLPDADRLLPTIASVLPEAFRELSDLLERDDLVEDWYYPLVTVDAGRAEEVWPELVSLSGLIRREADGGIGRATAAPEVVGSVARTEDGGLVGQGGLEEAFDERLTGSATTEVSLLDPEGREREVLFAFQSDPSPPLVTTLDRDVQQALDDAVLTIDEPVGVVVLDPATGGLLAVASRPSTGYPRALEGRYPPAAVAGLVPLAAALADGRDLDSAIPCPAQAVVGGVRVTTRTTPPSSATLRDALAGGCDVALAQLGLDAGDAGLLAAAATLGIDQAVDLPVPARGWSWPSSGSAAGVASGAIGHGQVEASALGAATLAATIARGAPVAPVLLQDEVVTATERLDAQLVAGLRTALRAAGEAGDVRVTGARVAGLAAVSGAVRGDPAPATAWWVGFVEGGGTDLAIAVVAEEADATRASEIAQRVLREVVPLSSDRSDS